MNTARFLFYFLWKIFRNRVYFLKNICYNEYRNVEKGRKMTNCTITLYSTIEDNGSVSNFVGTLQAHENGAELCYTDGNAQVNVSATPACVQIVRHGDYTLSLPLKSGQTTTGKIGIAGADGEVQIVCKKAEYSAKNGTFLLLAQYELVFGEERQKTSIRLYAKGIKK